MSGIAGLFHLDGRVADPASVHRMTRRIAHRGPDGAGVWTGGPVGVGHRMLAVMPEAGRETQPWVEGECVVACDARLDDRDALADRLDAPPSLPDVALVARAYRRWGVDAVSHLTGDFAVLIWDARERRFVGFRDPLGVKPLFVHHAPGRLVAVASEVKALLALDAVPDALDDARIAHYLDASAGADDATFYRAIRRLRPGHWLTVDARGRLRTERYWTLPTATDATSRTDAEWIEGFRERFRTAVSDRMRACERVGVMLSGGLDSSSVAGVARTTTAGVHAFSATFPTLPDAVRARSDERDYLRALTRLDGLNEHAIPVSDVSPLLDVGRVIHHLDHPPVICNTYLYRTLHAAAASEGVRVMLDGAEGDDTVSYGLGLFADLARAGQWTEMASEVAQLAARVGATPADTFWRFGAPLLTATAASASWGQTLRHARDVSRHVRVPVSRLLWRCAVKPSLPGSVRAAWDRLRGGAPASTSQAAPSLVRPALARRVRRPDDGAFAPPAADRIPASVEMHRRTFLEKGAALTTVLEEVDHLAAMQGIEQRHPFYDARLVAYCVACPASLKLRNGWTRYLLRAAMSGIVPDVVRWRTSKADLSPAFHRNLLRDAAPLLAHIRGNERLAPYLDFTALDAAVARADAPAIWRAAMLSLWLSPLARRRPDSRARRDGSCVRFATRIAQPNTMTKKPYDTPSLQVLGSIETLTQTGGCLFENYDKTIGFPSDTNFQFIPLTNCIS